jgi:branched-chain amino acid transport system substrate-binding protein
MKIKSHEDNKSDLLTLSEEQIVIGVSANLTSVDGERMKQGISMAGDDINSKGGILGRQLKFIFEDDQGNPAGSENAVKKLVTQNIVALIGPHLSSCVTAVDQIAKEYKIPFVSGGTSPGLLDLNNPYFFRVRPSDSVEATIAAKFAVETLKTQKIGIFYNNNQYGTGAKDSIEKYLTRVKIPFVSESHISGIKDFKQQINKMIDFGVNALIIWAHNDEIVLIARQLYEMGANIPCIGSHALSMKQVLDLMKSEWVRDWFTVANYISTDSNPIIKKFVSSFYKKHNTEPELFAAIYYGATMLLSDAISRAGSTESSKICEAFLKTKEVESTIGKYYSNSNGEMVHESNIARITNKKPAIIEHFKIVF